MKKSRFTEEQTVTILREAEKAPVAETAKKHGISEQTIYNWRQHFGGLDAADVKRLKLLEQENAQRQSHPMSADRAWRLLRLTGSQAPRRRVSVHRPWPQPRPTTAARHVWAYGFVFDTRTNGQQLKCLTMIDEYTRECLTIDVTGSIRSGRVIEVLSQLISLYGAPRYLRSDNHGPGFVSRGPSEASRAKRYGRGARRSQQSLAEWCGREPQRQFPRRMPEP